MSQAIATAIVVAKREEEIIKQNRRLDRAVAEIEAQRSELDLLVEIEQASTEAVNLEQFFQSLLMSTVARLDSERAFLVLSSEASPILINMNKVKKISALTSTPSNVHGCARHPPSNLFSRVRMCFQMKLSSSFDTFGMAHPARSWLPH